MSSPCSFHGGSTTTLSPFPWNHYGPKPSLVWLLIIIRIIIIIEIDGPDNGIGIRPMRHHSETSSIGLVNLKSWQEMVMASFRYTFLIVSFVPKTLDGVMRTKVMTIYDKLLLYIQCMSWSKYEKWCIPQWVYMHGSNHGRQSPSIEGSSKLYIMILYNLLKFCKTLHENSVIVCIEKLR